MRYKHLSDFYKLRNATITSILRLMCEKYTNTRTCPCQAKNIHTFPKSPLGGLPVTSINSMHIAHTLIAF